MRLAVMQPYLFPYLGYYQLVNAVDKFVFFDDVNYINRGWINRNQILQKEEPFLFTVPLVKASQNRLINEIEISDYTKWRGVFLKQIEFNYKRAPNFLKIFSWLSGFLHSKEYILIRDLTADSIRGLASLLKLKTEFIFSSEIDYKSDSCGDGESKILKICEIMGADVYINPKNGIDLYNTDHFSDKKIRLNFIFIDGIVYQQFSSEKFVPNLSIIDVLMFNDIEQTMNLLNQYKLN